MGQWIYKICTRTEWNDALGVGVYAGSDHDRADGFVHFSTAGQVVETAAKHFAQQDDLVIVAVDPARLDEHALKWEPSRGGDLFPHLYGSLPADTAVWVKDLPWCADDKRHLFPPDMNHG